VGRLRRAIHLVDGTFDSDYVDFPQRAIAPETVAAAVIDLLSGERSIDAAVFLCLTPRSPTLAALRAELARRSLPSRETEVPCLAMELPKHFDDYLKQLKPRVRSKVRQSFRLAEEAKVAFSWCDDPAMLARHLEGLFALHAMRWNAVGKTGCFVEPKRRAFFGQLAEGFLAAKQLRFARAEIAGTPVAYQIGVVVRGTFYQLQEGFDTSFEKQRVATALRGWVVARLIEEGARRYDFMAGPAQHKSEWGGQIETCSALAFALPRLRARVAFTLRKALDRVRAKRGDSDPSGGEAESVSTSE
jgi:CelD/BcsL family acetyltransferase involved in cellulose biosynthesis